MPDEPSTAHRLHDIERQVALTNSHLGEITKQLKRIVIRLDSVKRAAKR